MVVRIVVAAVAASLALVAPLNASKSDWYFAVEGGKEFGGQFNNSNLGEGELALFATITRRLGGNFSLETELGYRTSTEQFFTTADITQTSVMFNGVYEASLSEDVSILVGAGLGLDRVEVEDVFFGGNDLKAAVQLKLGLSLAIDESIDLVANYRTMYAYENDFTDIDNSSLTVGLRFAF